MTPTNSATVLLNIGQPTAAPPGERAGGENERRSEREGDFDRVFASGRDEATHPEEKQPEGRSSVPADGPQAEAAAHETSAPAEGPQAEAAGRRVSREASAMRTSETEDAAILSDLATPAFAIQATEAVGEKLSDLPAPTNPAGGSSPAAGSGDTTPGERQSGRAVEVSIETPGQPRPERSQRPSESFVSAPAAAAEAAAKPPAAIQARQEPAAAAKVAVSVSAQPQAAEAGPQTSPSPDRVGSAAEPAAQGAASQTAAQEPSSAAKVSVSVSVQPRAAAPAAPIPQPPEAAGAQPELRDQAKPSAESRSQIGPLRSSPAAGALATSPPQWKAAGPAPLAVDLAEAAGSEIGVTGPTDSASALRGAASRPVSAAMGAVAIQVQNQVEILANGRTVHVRLDPPDLGSFEVRLELSGTAVHAVVASDRADTLELLARHRSELIAILADAGFDVLDARFEGGGETPPDVSDEKLLAVESLADAEETSPTPSRWVPNSWLESGGRLDIRA